MNKCDFEKMAVQIITNDDYPKWAKKIKLKSLEAIKDQKN